MSTVRNTPFAQLPGHRIWPQLAFAAAALFFGTLLIFQPAQVYAGNSAFFYLPFAQLAVVLVPLWLVLSLLGSLPSRFGPVAWRRAWAGFLCLLAAIVWVCGAFLYGGQGLLDGRALDDAVQPADSLSATAMALLAGLGALGLGLRWPRRVAQFTLLVIVLSLLPVALLMLRDEHAWRGAPDVDALARFSSEQNVLVVLLDTFQSDFLVDVLNAEPGLRERFAGFVNYRQAAGVAPTTYLSLPAIHSGVTYEPGMALRGYYDRAVVEGSFLSGLAEKGFRADLLNPMMNKCPKGVRCLSDEVLLNGLARGSVESSVLLIDLALLRSVPAVLRNRVFNQGMFVLGNLLDPQSGHPRSNEALRLVTARASVGGPPSVKFLHLFGSHPPARIDAQCQVGVWRDWTRENAIAQDRCALRLVGELLSQLDRLAVLDATTVVVLADHGAGLPIPPASVMQAYAAPLLMIKPPRSREPLRDSDASVSVADVAASVCDLTRACKASAGQSVALAGKEGAGSGGFYVDYTWQHPYWYLESVPISARYRIAGSPWDPLSWRLEGDGSGLTAELRFGGNDDPRHFGPGWWTTERTGDGRDFRWVVGHRAVVYLKPAADWRGEIGLRGFTHPGNDRQALEVFIDGKPVWRGPFAPELNITLDEKSKPGAAFALGLVFAQDEPPGPMDTRRLSGAIERILLR